MDWQSLVTALCLVLVIEGLMPFLAPASWKAMLLTISQMGDRQLRIIGLASMLTGTFILYLIR
ncbi:MAG: DUF2065 domain-containing protein [Pseudomonadaceae bacterium]|nr:MAG: DUF2065 domain-containing protein [Pseudomonadaceae bacterium]